MNSLISDNVLDTNTVTDTLRNSHCIICGTPFNTARVGKLYCSDKCKQFSYNHKEKIFRSKNISGTGISAKPQTYYIEDFQFYNDRRRMLKRYKELCYKRTTWESAENEIENCERSGSQAQAYTWNIYNSRKLSDNEEGELNELETNIEDEIVNLKFKELSIEQWSFIKSLHPSFDGISLCEIIASLGTGFFSQLTLNPPDRNTNQNVIIKNKYINHCNLIVEGLIKFVKKPVNEENEN